MRGASPNFHPRNLVLTIVSYFDYSTLRNCNFPLFSVSLKKGETGRSPALRYLSYSGANSERRYGRTTGFERSARIGTQCHQIQQKYPFSFRRVSRRSGTRLFHAAVAGRKFHSLQ